MRRLGLILLVAAAIALTGCGAKEVKLYRVAGTADCLRKGGYRVRTDARNLGLVAASASGGALRAFEQGNTVTISFGGTHSEAVNISHLYRKFAPKRLRPHIDDVMRVRKNAVLLWTVTPPLEEENKVDDCLQG